ncbi:ODA1, partial [Symbiodinium sp. KB8]
IYWDVAKREVELVDQSEQLAKYEDAFRKIQEETGISTIDEMVSEFLQAEDHNFSLINMINELNKELEALEVEHAALQKRVQVEASRSTQTDEERGNLFSSMEQQIRDTREKSRAFAQKHEKAMKIMESMRPGIMTIFQKVSASAFFLWLLPEEVPCLCHPSLFCTFPQVGTNEEAVAESLISTGVTDGNVLQFLGLIEQRVSEIVQMYRMAQGGQSVNFRDQDHASLPDFAAEEEGFPNVFGSQHSSIGGDRKAKRAVASIPAVPSMFEDAEELD